MPSLKDVQLKIQGVKKTKQITKAMGMVATSRLRGAQGAMDGFRPYAEKFSEVLGSLAEKAGDEASPLLIPKEDVKKIHVVICTSDRGLCGGFNINLTDSVKNFIKNNSNQDAAYSFTCFGKKGRDWCRKGNHDLVDEHLGVVGSKFGFNVASTAGKKLVDGFLDGTYDEVYLVYSEFVSMAKQLPIMQKLLPIPPIETDIDEADEPAEYLAEHLCEPSAEELLGDLLPRNVYVQIYRGLLETSTSEHAARMSAMDNATKACNDMIDNLTLAYNKARQAAITADLMDIVGGAEALKG
ncbi:ATP synthase gamma chain [Desulfosarcina ovata subsp. sediminis]|uniref:ATP synthase gamma chain n=1 Tax=Desulfosarcina ovata subsp. sediminis TaxID=885957 RepID=A0A5K7ZZH4_9BACT|nr:ATP synthase F1 subunit gamma [Desulfosarcina ovata]BBO85652.1 ATP synthase gamma chain [Desulfosarcina ovata subsp. sediminis]